MLLGRYLWRIAIAFHLGPRLLIVSSYYHFLLSFVSRLPKKAAVSLANLLKWCFYLQITEIIGLCGISFVHNWEHYRELIFAQFVKVPRDTFLIFTQNNCNFGGYYLFAKSFFVQCKMLYFLNIFIFIF